MAKIAKELEDRLWYLADPKVQWVQGNPVFPHQACLVQDGWSLGTRFSLSPATQDWLNDFVRRYASSWGPTPYWVDLNATRFNDAPTTTHRDILLMLEEAVDQAKWEDV